MLARSSGTTRDGHDFLPLDCLFELVVLVVAGECDWRERAAHEGPNKSTLCPAPATTFGRGGQTQFLRMGLGFNSAAASAQSTTTGW